MSEHRPSNARLTSSLALRLGGSAGLLLLLAIITIGGIVIFVQQQQSDAEIIDIAGRQGVLSQATTKYAYQVVQGQSGKIDNLRDSAAQFEASLAALRNGTEPNETFDLPFLPAAPESVLPALDLVQTNWASFNSNVQKILDSELDSIEQQQGINALATQNESLLVLSESVVAEFTRVSNEKLNNLQIFLGIIGVLDLIVFGLTVFVIRRTLLQTNNLVTVVNAIELGNMQARAEVVTSDELGRFAGAMNQMLDNTLTLVQSSEERTLIEQSVRQLQSEVGIVAEGDLTVEAEVTPTITGDIAESFNMMIQQLRGVIENVQATTLQVSSAANEVQTTAEHLAYGSETQATQIIDTTAAIDEMAVSIQQVSENSALSATISQQALASANSGRERVDNSISGMSQIRQNVQETSKRIKRLGESSQEIGEIVQSIRAIAKRTSILALNAAIQAARAGEAGRSFAVVAEEVERLADRAAEATREITQLTNTIQSEIAGAVAAMEATTQEVVNGTRLNNEVAESFTEIQDVSYQLAEVIQSTSLAAQQQARGSETIARSMNEIAEITQQTASGTKQASVSISNLAQLADELRSSVSTFKLSTNGSA